MTSMSEMRMVEIEIIQDDGPVERRVLALPVLIGRDERCDLRLRSWRVARMHARLSAHAGDLLLEDLGSWHGTWVNQRRIARYGPLMPEDLVVIGACRLQVRRLAPQVDGQGRQGDGGSGAAAQLGMPVFPAGQPAQGLTTAGDAAGPAAAEAIPLAMPLSQRQPAVDSGLVRRLHGVLLQELDLRRRNVEDMNDAALRSQAHEVLSAWLSQHGRLDVEEGPHGVPEGGRLPADAAGQRALLERVLDEALGYGPLQPLMAEDGITEIMVNGHEEIYVERQGRLQRHDAVFSSEAALLAVMERMVAPVGRRLDENMPLADARLPDGSRVHAVIRPIAVQGPSLTIRRFPRRRPGLDELVSLGALDQGMSSFLAQCVRLRCNIIVAGGTGSGKTTLLNALSHCIAPHERVITIEDAAELRLQHAHKVVLEARPPNQEGKGAISIRELVRNALRMRPDRIVVGECRGAEALDMLAAMNTGHEGSLTTLHANSPRDALARLETMVLMAGMALPLAAVREQIAASVDLLVQLVRLPDGRRVIAEVTELCGIESQCLQTLPLFSFDRRSGSHRRGASVPTFFESWRKQGIDFDPTSFPGPGYDTTAENGWHDNTVGLAPTPPGMLLPASSWADDGPGRRATP
ncbi:ATPase, T2SS/T4P/T4SS family [Kerstersia gyiorum]|uniref:ATPase, T2SS/T4P/T4SS family n=1 Tax=Kerstersia gyiorum TaxID=206506 RepID=UPI00214FCD39|nr:ATPase, T2SS/T4P/T4SS family [Kerstersia gyiorum]MCR4159800.1 ATPase, T2SS/T4P/T4SS family [Kerstersia gyiorum]